LQPVLAEWIRGDAAAFGVEEDLLQADSSKLVVWAIVAGGVLAGHSQASDRGKLPCRYEPTIVYGPPCPGNPDAFHPITPKAINSAGQVAGYYGGCLGGADNGFVWTAETGVVTVPPPQGTSNLRALDITEPPREGMFGSIAGTLVLSGLGDRGYLFDWRQFTILQPLPIDLSTLGNALNTQGTAVGVSKGGAGGHFVAAYWNSKEAQELSGLLGPHSEAMDINDAGAITGWMGHGVCAECNTHGFLWEAREVTDLGFMPGSIGTQPAAISNAQQIVGNVIYPDAQTIIRRHAFTWSGGLLIALPLLPKFESSRALDVNDEGLIVGECDADAAGLPARAVLWHNGLVHDLNDMVPDPDDVIFLSLAEGINNDGVIIGKCDCGPEHDDHTALVILTPAYPSVGDLNCDEIVNVVDLSILLAQWGPGNSLSADFNGDGMVGPFDLAQLLANWGSATIGAS
jgi:uncharacterized membrane protein